MNREQNCTDMLEEIERLKQENEELLDALKLLMDWEPRQKDAAEKDAYDQARAVIAKRKGGAHDY